MIPVRMAAMLLLVMMSNGYAEEIVRDGEKGVSVQSEGMEKAATDAEALLKSGNAKGAYSLLEPLEFEYAGKVRFDYLLGISALDSGKPDKATLAFERVLAVDPNFAGARLDMARAYYQLGDLARAKTEFELVMGQNPPEAARATIQKYLDAIASFEESKKTHVAGYVEGMLGSDSNVSTGTSSSIAVSTLSPGLAALITGLTGDPNPQIPPSSRRDNYYGVNAGADVSRNLGENWQLYAGADVRQHGNMTQILYDTSSLAGRAGVMFAEGQNAYKVTLTWGQSYSSNSMRRDSTGANLEWQHLFSPSNQMNAFMQYAANRAVGSPPTAPGTDARTSGNTDLTTVGAGWVHVLAEGKQALFGSVYLGDESDKVPVNVLQPVDGKKRFNGVRVGGQATLSEDLAAFANLSWQNALYSKPNAFITGGGGRKEQQYDVVVGANWRLSSHWSFKPQVTYTKKSSNLAIYSFDRTDVSLTVRRDFN